MYLSFFDLPPAQPRGDECSSLLSSTRGNEAKPDFKKQSAARPYSVTVVAHDTCSSTPAIVVRAAFLCLFSCFLSPSHICLFCLHLSHFNNSSMPVPTTQRSPSHSADSILQVPSTTFTISHLSVFLGDMMIFTEVFVTTARNFTHFIFYFYYFFLLFTFVSPQLIVMCVL